MDKTLQSWWQLARRHVTLCRDFGDMLGQLGNLRAENEALKVALRDAAECERWYISAWNEVIRNISTLDGVEHNG